MAMSRDYKTTIYACFRKFFSPFKKVTKCLINSSHKISVLENLSVLLIPVTTVTISTIPHGNCMFKVNNRNNRTRFKVINEGTRRKSIGIEHISHFPLVFSLLTLSRQMPPWIARKV